MAALSCACAARGSDVPPQKASEERGAAPTFGEIGDLKGLRFEGIDVTVDLSDGRWEGEPYVAGTAARPSVNLVDSFILIGDIDHDGAFAEA